MESIRNDMNKIKQIRARDVARYMILPGIMPRIRAFAGSGFGWLAILMAQIYYSVRLLPAGHPYLNPLNKGRFGIRHVIAEAANNVRLKRENIDQLVIFVAILLGFLLLVLQVTLLLFSIFIKPVMAADFAGLFATPNPTNDIAFMLLDKVFAIPGLYGSQFAPGGPGDIPLFNQALQELFRYYNMVILIVGVFILLYYVVIMVGETMQSGTPFGRRFNHIWAPLRLVAAVGLLVPLNYGFNSAQYITLFAAKMGSGMATNGWIVFNRALTEANAAGANPTTYNEREQLLAYPKASDYQHLVAFMSVVTTCKLAYEHEYRDSDGETVEINPWLVNGENFANPLEIGYEASLEFYENRDIHIVFGHQHEKYRDDAGHVKPYCGRITVHTNDVTQPGTIHIQRQYFAHMLGMWEHADGLWDLGRRAIDAYLPSRSACTVQQAATEDCRALPPAEFKTEITTFWQNIVEQDVDGARALQLAALDSQVPQEVIDRGWAGAGIWYNRIAQWNGSLFAAVMNIPTPSSMPLIMERIQEARRGQDEHVDALYRFEPYLQKDNSPVFHASSSKELDIGRVLNRVYLYWQLPAADSETDVQVSGNIFFDVLNAIFGVNGLFEMRQNAEVHPLAQLVGLGKSVLESAIRNLMTSLAFSFLGGMGGMLNQHLGASLNHMSSMFVGLASVGITIGFVLYYVLPFLPFMYFFFAVGGWVKSIFEAMVGVPLWALAHLRVDGNGFPADQAMNGYFLIFEIFIRPILCVFGLLAGIAIFAALARTLNDLFDLVVANLTGFDCTDCPGAGGEDAEGQTTLQYVKRNIIDEFFYTVIYTILVYLMATSSFKLIDQIPNGIMRWMGSGVQTFNDQRGDPAGDMVQYAAIGGYSISGQVIGAVNTGAAGLGRIGGQAISSLASRNPATRTTGS